MIIGGDGAFCFWDKNEPQYFGGSYYYNRYTFFNNGSAMGSNFNSSGIFVNPADLDYNLNLVYANATDFTGTSRPNYLLKLSNIYSNYPSESYINLNTGLSVYYSAVTYSPYSPLNKSTLFAGSVSGHLYKVREAQSMSPQINEITGSNFPNGNISCIALGASEDTIMAIFSNYGVSSIWLSNDGGLTWADKEGNLPDMPVRWGMFYPGNSNYALIATETGVWVSNNMNQSAVTWTPQNTGMANVRTDMLKFRTSDHRVLAATHGRGLFTTTWDIPVGTEEIKSRDLAIYPNPSQGAFYLKAKVPAPDDVKISITNSAGQTVETKLVNTSSGTIIQSFDLSLKPKGIYILTLISGTKNLGERKIVIY